MMPSNHLILCCPLCLLPSLFPYTTLFRSNNLRYADDTALMAESEEELKEPLDEGESDDSEKAVLKLNIQKTKIMASGPITSWQIDGETMETVTDFIF